jgi:hypothetical protein
MSQLALFRNSDPSTSKAAAAMQQPTRCEREVLAAIAGHDARFGDLTAIEVWAKWMPCREYSTVKTCYSRLVKSGHLVVTGARKPDGKRAPQSTYQLTDAGRELLRA